MIELSSLVLAAGHIKQAQAFYQRGHCPRD
jgi:hypothetical protein